MRAVPVSRLRTTKHIVSRAIPVEKAESVNSTGTSAECQAWSAGMVISRMPGYSAMARAAVMPTKAKTMRNRAIHRRGRRQ